jgi:peptidoglycan hydrolase-like protein with peptidoglycan-binding domain
LITTLPLRNAQLNEGDVLLTASGRPVFILQGDVPAYRDLVPGISGNDVRQLKLALRRLGHDPGAAEGPFDQRTSDAVAEWYRSRGWEPFGPTREQLAAVRALERDYNDALKVKVAADLAYAAAGLAVASARATSAHSVQSAALEAARSPPQGNAADASLTGASLVLETERAKAAYANAAAEADVSAQIADRELIVLDPRQPETARLAADAKLAVARAARERIKREGELAVQTAERDVMLAAARAELAQSAERAAELEGEKAVRAAIDAQKLAALDARIATGRVDQLAAELQAARHKLGVQVPVDEVVFIRTLPVRIQEVTAVVGGAAAGSIMTVTDNQLSVDASLPLDAAPRVRPGMPVVIDESSLGVKATGVVDTVANTPGTHGVDGFHIYLDVRVDATPVRLEGFSVRLTIPIESTAGAVTAVPVSALSLAADGRSRVQVEKNGTLEFIAVKPGLSAAGYVEVVPVDAKLIPGQRVVVGYDNPTSRVTK